MLSITDLLDKIEHSNPFIPEPQITLPIIEKELDLELVMRICERLKVARKDA